MMYFVQFDSSNPYGGYDQLFAYSPIFLYVMPVSLNDRMVARNALVFILARTGAR